MPVQMRVQMKNYEPGTKKVLLQRITALERMATIGAVKMKESVVLLQIPEWADELRQAIKQLK